MSGAKKRLVVIGGDAAGLSAAAQARRLRAAGELDIVVLEQGPEVSYSACGIPYWIGGSVAEPRTRGGRRRGDDRGCATADAVGECEWGCHVAGPFCADRTGGELVAAGAAIG